MEKIPEKIPPELLEQATKKELLKLLQVELDLRYKMEAKLYELETFQTELKDGITRINGVLVRLKNRLFGKSSERSNNKKNKTRNIRKKRKNFKKLPSERYPDAPVIEREIELEEIPFCSCCGKEMSDSGLKETSEYLEVIPKRYTIIRQIRHKYNCRHCHSDLKTAPGVPRIKPGSSYSNDMIIDIAMTKYCDLIPADRYRAIAERLGFPGLPANSLIEATHHLADFVTPAVEKVRQEVLEAKILHADETPHRMLEGDKKTSWYLWGFSTNSSCYFDIRDTRSGNVAHELLMQSKCEYLVSDVFSGYLKATRITNDERRKSGKPQIKNAWCNAHARRKFKECSAEFDSETEFYIDHYREIYSLESQTKNKDPEDITAIRKKMIPHFEAIRNKAEEQRDQFSTKSSFTKAINYYLENYPGLALFINHPDIPIDNNPQERLLRNPVIGRKNWYGTHSRRGAETAAKLFTLVESCKLNTVNPRQYFTELTRAILIDLPPFSPKEFKEKEKT